MISDSYNRTFKTLRISLINTCNLACTYCVSEEEGRSKKESKINIQKSKIKNHIELAQIVKQLHSILKLETIRLTGGEPTLYKDIVPFIEALQPMGVPIKLTTNGYLLKNLLEKLPDSALDSINISLDALDEDVFFQISKRRNLSKILEAIDLALAKNIHIKLNCVVIKGVNDQQILPLLEYAGKRNITVRFLELMRMGHYHNANFENDFFSETDILNLIKQKYSIYKLERQKSATANHWLTDSGYKFGIIANETEPFCHDCNRLRLDSYGNIYGCLSENSPISVSETTDLTEALTHALKQKQPVKFTGSALSMLEIGG